MEGWETGVGADYGVDAGTSLSQGGDVIVRDRGDEGFEVGVRGDR